MKNLSTIAVMGFFAILLISGVRGKARAQVPPVVPILFATQHSGLVPPQYRFSIHCNLDQDGRLHSEVSSVNEAGEWGAHEIIDRTLGQDEVTQIRAWIAESTVGPFEQIQNPCDIGGLVLTAFHAGQPIAILESHDCDTRVTNHNPSAKKLLAWARKECKLR